MVNKLFEHIGTKIVLANPWLDTYSVNCIEIPFSNGEKRIVNLEGDEKVDLGFDDASGNGFYIKINPRFTYTEQRQLSSTKRDFLVSIRFRFVFFGINTEIEYSKLGLENKFATAFRNISFSDYIGNERSVKLNISQTNTDALQIFKEEVGKDYDFGAESVFIALDGALSFLSTDNYCDSECGIAVSESTLKTLDFCDPAIIALLNAKQRECLEKEFGGGGGLTCEDLPNCPTIIAIEGEIATETQARISGDQTLQTNIDNEAQSRSDEDATLLALIQAIQANPTLAQILANGNLTNEQSISSNDGHTNALFYNGYAQVEVNGNRKGSNLYLDDSIARLYYINTTNGKSGTVSTSETKIELIHTDLIELTAPSAKINGDEILAYKWYGDVNANSNGIINLRDAVAPQEPITKSQFDSYISAVGQQRGSIDCSTNPNYPASNVGDRWEVTVSGKIGGASGIDVQVYDEIVCKTQSVSGDQAAVGANFYIVQGNLERASETVSGYTQYANDAEVQAETENTKTFTSLKLGNWFGAKKLLAHTWSALQTFSSGVYSSLFVNDDGEFKFKKTVDGTILIWTNGQHFRFSATVGGAPSMEIDKTTGKIKLLDETASTPLKLDANKGITSGAFGTTAGTFAEGSALALKLNISDALTIGQAKQIGRNF